MFIAAAFAVLVSMPLISSCKHEDPDTPDQGRQLSVPELSVSNQSYNSFDIAIGQVDNASAYVYSIAESSETPDEEFITTERAISFSSLKFETSYTVRVKAISDDPAYTDSEYASIEVSLTGVPDFFNMTVYLNAIPDQNTYEYNSIFLDIEGTDVTVCRIFRYISSEIAGWEDEALIEELLSDANADASSFIPRINNGGVRKLAFKGLQADTEYTVAAYVENEEGARLLIRENISTEEMPEVTDELAAWIGTWQGVSEGTVHLDEDMKFQYIQDKQKEFTVTFSAYPGNPTLLQTAGLSSLLSGEQGGIGFASLDRDGNLQLLSNQIAGVDSEGNSVVWINIALNDANGSVNLVNTCPYSHILEMDESGNTAKTIERYASQYTSGLTFVTIGAELFGSSSAGLINYGELPADLIGGDMTLTRVGSTAAMPLTATE